MKPSISNSNPVIASNDAYRREYMLDIETKINTEIGYRFWKKYVNAAFWSYISLPINLSITMMTALSTGQATTDNLLPKSLYINISLATLVISVLNTYFRPYVQMNQNIEYMNKWSVLGCQFEEIYYSENQTLEHINLRIGRYENLMKSINDLKKTEILESQNFVTDSIHLALRSCYCCLKNKNSWLALDETLKAEDDDAKKRLAEDDDLDTENIPDNTELFTLTDVGISPSPQMEQLYLAVGEETIAKTMTETITETITETMIETMPKTIQPQNDDLV